MSARVINLNQDLRRLRDEGYELEIKDGHAIVHNVPYLDERMTIQYGLLISPLEMRGDVVSYNNNGAAHVIYFQGTHPYRSNGTAMSGIVLEQFPSRTIAGFNVNFSFSNKPQGGYTDYYEKFTRYIAILQAEAQAFDSSITARTYQRIAEDEEDIFVYADTNASRATITDISDKLKNQKIGIIGLGGTGSYVLDQIAKTPVLEIHLFDGDVFCQHNAFRAPGAPSKECLESAIKKVDYFAKIYGNMHKHVVPHPIFISETNADELTSLDFVFLCMDTGEHKRSIITSLMNHCVPFIDTGIDISEHNRELLGTARTTSVCFGSETTYEDAEIVNANISFEPVNDADIYRSNIQTSDLNALCALMAVIKWKKYCGFYQDLCHYQNRIYNTNDGDFK